MIDNNFMESFGDFAKSYTISEAEKAADDNQKIKDKMEKAQEAKKNARVAKEEYEELQKENDNTSLIEIALLKYKKFKAQAEMIAADAKLIKKGIQILDDEKSQEDKKSTREPEQ